MLKPSPRPDREHDVPGGAGGGLRGAPGGPAAPQSQSQSGRPGSHSRPRGPPEAQSQRRRWVMPPASGCLAAAGLGGGRSCYRRESKKSIFKWTNCVSEEENWYGVLVMPCTVFLDRKQCTCGLGLTRAPQSNNLLLAIGMCSLRCFFLLLLFCSLVFFSARCFSELLALS